MPNPDGHRERSRDLERLLTFVDAIAAVAITLLVLPLVDLAGEVGPGDSVANVISSHSSEFWAFLLSFGVIARLWTAQHKLMSPVVESNAAVTQLLIGWTLAMVFLPFGTILVANAGDEPVTRLIYIGTLAFSALCLAAIAVVVRTNPSLHDPAAVPSVRSSSTVAATLLLALAISLIFPATSYYPLLLMLADNVKELVRGISARIRGR